MPHEVNERTGRIPVKIHGECQRNLKKPVTVAMVDCVGIVIEFEHL
jgi:hypothetical protein